VFGIVLIALKVWQAPSGDFVGGMWYALIGRFVFAAQASYQQVVMREALRGGPGVPVMAANPDHRAFANHHRQLIDVYRHRHNMFPGGRQRPPGSVAAA
jgi:hypothetical protein